jgi:hypothetical protein
MFQACFFAWNDWALVASRTTVSFAGLSVVLLSVKQLLRIRRGKRPSAIPTALWGFTLFWSVVFTGIATFLLLSCGQLRYGVMAPTYVASIAWTIIGLVSIMVTGIKEYDRSRDETRRFQNSLKDVIAQTQTED